MTSRIRNAYDIRVEEGVLTPDPAQAEVLVALERLETDLARRGLFGRPPEVKGIYLWGPPGRGKSMLMDLFYSATPEPRKTRAHFHAFMARIHDLVRQWREGDAKTRKAVFGTHKGDDPIPPIAKLIASEARLLCFDELQVTDIADAMILGRLFEALFEDKVVLAITSNRAPEDLYKNGINRQLFTPFIDIIRDRCAVVQTAGARDWRLDRLSSAEIWHTPDDRAGFEELWRELKGGEPEEPAHLAVLGRDVVIERTVGSMARASFADLCGRPLGPQDYLAVAERFHTLFLEDVPILSSANHHEARRLVTLVDALYEAKTKLIVLAAARPEALYTEGVGAFEFERTVSRFNEMQSKDWLAHVRE
ncbi:MAG: AFG1 family ATPase [Alphaproteobacteria bacterium]|uniref:cell division protein ZapE n=1 Tax=unclassified Brevundimonas TaxID=2622653 RepID=UPI001A21C4A5|nr:cell division protein ZapE [Brevundimonas sp.]MBJ7320219.1 AFG1 family ATPase [Brevundimonas sp.]MBU2029687.1 AFG1 family ATPase [Alphaproteobacteria bacterium]MBU2165011.1 AFG1 family ATPase [Alphaproteobacteria bacterium]MBU2232705.1 AFG1 family ATPase [Alphaproteobacteria bacterium]